ncbi:MULTISPECIES: hypothetical protein [unclassified Sphingomonas]|uniref:hypothetical protein n=1 Tax=unclassified Sphingomonas TaxID=196159 RepID=UPI00269C5258
MRFAIGFAGLLLLLAGCSPIGVDPAAMSGGQSPTGNRADTSNAALGDDFDYRYAFRMPAARIAEVQDSHVRACDQLGRARCRVLTNRYHVNDADNSVTAVLAFQIDPVIARTFGRNSGAAVKNAGGLVMDSRMIGSDGAARGGGIVARLREEIANIDMQLRGNVSDAQRAAAEERQMRLRAAVATISELDRGATQGLATTPVLFTYQSGTVIPSLGGSATATFDNAGETFIQSAAAMTQVLAGVGPWIIVLVGVALILRQFIPREEPEVVRVAPIAGAEPAGEPSENRGTLQRWFGREADAPKETEEAR